MLNLIYIAVFIIILLIAIYFIFKYFKKGDARFILINKDDYEWTVSSKEQFKKLFEEAPTPFFILNKKGEIKEINKSALRFFGATPDEILTKSLFSFATEEDTEYAGYLQSFAERNVPINNKEFRMISKNGEVKWIRLSVLAFTDKKRNSNSNLATLFDITEQKNLDNAKTEFVSLASHQLRAPLATVKWYTEMLSNPVIGDLNQKQKDYIKTISDVNVDMIELVDTLLNVSRIEIGKLSVNFENTNVQKITESILTELSSQIINRKMNIIKKYNDLFLNIKSDSKLLRIVIHNLITNAIKYTPEGGTITITFKENGTKNQIIVTDTGLGIPKSQQAKIFTKLFRADNVKEISSSQSTGLGLYLVQSLIKAMGGDISFESEEGKGTSFMVNF